MQKYIFHDYHFLYLRRMRLYCRLKNVFCIKQIVVSLKFGEFIHFLVLDTLKRKVSPIKAKANTYRKFYRNIFADPNKVTTFANDIVSFILDYVKICQK